MSSEAFDAAVFDLDGVLTITQKLHQTAWKALFDGLLRRLAERRGEPFQAFTEADYRAFVDGRPRLDGIRRFLAAREIALPEGAPDDPPDVDTVFGLAARKNALFRESLDREGVEVDEAAVALVRSLRARGVRVGIASSSRNTRRILQRAGLEALADAVVDGVVLQEEGLRGKPAPDMFLHCLARLGTISPGRAMVVEDAGAGVAAGREGGFGLVLGVDRGGNWALLREKGADWIIRDFREVQAERLERWFEGRPHRRPNALARWDELGEKLRGRRLALFLDYDGTLTPIVERPELAVLGAPMREALEAVARVWPTHVVSGRGLADVKRLVGFDQLWFAASHGFEIEGPHGSGAHHEVDPSLAPLAGETARELSDRLSAIPGALVESKRFSVAVHYRLVEEARVPELEAIVDDVLSGRPALRKATGKKVFELRPSLAWDKGTAVLWMLRTLGLDGPDVLPVYVGDDTTDEDAFRELQNRGLGIVVLEVPRPTLAHWSLQNVDEVRTLLTRLAALKESR